MMLNETVLLNENEELERIDRKILHHQDQLTKYRRLKTELADRLKRKRDNESDRDRKAKERRQKVVDRARIMIKKKKDRSIGSGHDRGVNIFGG
jgi:ElaB/YqjD/DUF883 family membrane-anchored ribosome-binding protein